MKKLEDEGLVYYVYYRYFKRFYRYNEDLLQEGRIALLTSKQTYDKSVSKFSTYACPAIYWAMSRFITNITKGNDKRDFEYEIDDYEDKSEQPINDPILTKSYNIAKQIMTVNSNEHMGFLLDEYYLKLKSQVEVAYLFDISCQRVSQIVQKFNGILKSIYRKVDHGIVEKITVA